MNNRRTWIALCCAVALIGLPACNDDDDDTPPLDTQSAEQVVQATMAGVVVPLVTVMEVVAQVSTAAQARVQTPRGATCDPVGNCTDGGTYQVCVTGATFTTCEEAGVVIDGEITVTDPLTQTVVFDLDVSGTSLVGPAQLVEFVSCGPGLTFDGLTGSAQGVTASVDGTLELCGSPYPFGTLDSTAMASGVTADVALTFNGSSVVGAVVSDPSSGEIVTTCTVNILPAVTTECF